MCDCSVKSDSSRESSWPQDRTLPFWIGRQILCFFTEPPGKPTYTIVNHLIFTVTPWSTYQYYPHYWDKKTEAQECPVACTDYLYLWIYVITRLCCCCCSVAQLCPTPCDPMDCSMPGFPVHHQLSELAQTHVHRVAGAIQPSHPLLSPSLSVVPFHLSQHQGLFQWVSSSHWVAKILELQLQLQH